MRVAPVKRVLSPEWGAKGSTTASPDDRGATLNTDAGERDRLPKTMIYYRISQLES